MTDHDPQPRPDAAALKLQKLTRAYPSFKFRHERAGRRGHRWTAERRNGADPGLHTAITRSLAELLRTLHQDSHARDAR